MSGSKQNRRPMAADLIPWDKIEVKGSGARKISDATAEHFRYGFATYKGERVQIAPYYDADGRLVAQHIRTRDKDFPWTGSPSDALPFGAHAFPKSGKMICVTEGEIDALSLSQVQGNKWPVVSIGCGASAESEATKVRKYFAKHRSYFNAFDKIILMFDMDDPGRKSATAAAQVLGSKAHIAELPHGFKDANDMLVAGKTKELLDAMWRANPYRPDGLVDMATLLNDVLETPVEGVEWVFRSLTRHTYGKRLGELVSVGAGTGVGKTDFLTQDMLHMVRQGHKIGVFALEQQPRETALRFIGKAAEKPIHIPEHFDADLIRSTWDGLVRNGMLWLFDHFGAMDWDTIQDNIEYLYHSEGVQYFYLDHLTALAAAEDNEKEGLERIMSQMGALVKRLPIHVTFVSHLTTPDGKPHEEGGRVTIRHFKGSRSIGFWSHFMFGLERDQQADDEASRTTTTFRILKDRYTGRSTGEVFYLGYDRERGLLFETDKPDSEAKSYGFRDESADDDEPTTTDF